MAIPGSPPPYTFQISNPTIGNGEGRVSSAYKDANGNNALTTITPTNTTGYRDVVEGSTRRIGDNPPGLLGLSYAVGTDGRITYKYDDQQGNIKFYSSIQQLASGGIVGYNSQTTTQIKNAIKSNLDNQVKTYNQANPTTPIGPATASNPNPTGSNQDPPKPDPQETVPQVFEGIDVVEAFGGPQESAGSYNPKGKEAWIYPTGIADNKQDYIKFNMISYGPRKGITPTGNIGQRTFGGTTDSQVASGKTREILGTVILPIQPAITDQNLVDWQNDTMNPLQAAGASIALQASGSNAGAAVEASIGQLVEKLGGDEGIKQYLRYWAAGKAVGTNLFSRIAGATVNPNLELLFNGPQLRPFNFNFRLSPRSQEEAKIVKGIIRFFKKGMSISRRTDNLFLKAPNVFEIQYINGQTGKPHNSINKIKICALTNCGVDYTPDGTYATFYDNESTMTSYGLTLQFNELEPIFKDDYDNNQTSIGY